MRGIVVKVVVLLCMMLMLRWGSGVVDGIQQPQMGTPSKMVSIGGYYERMDWPNFNGTGISHFGQVSGVAVNSKNEVYVFHRSERVWDFETFDKNDVMKESEFISAPTIYKFDSQGNFISKWGSNLFLMPHGISVDSNDDIWVTDVGRHQIFKILTHNNNDQYSLNLTLGTFKTPGNDPSHFCKPTDIAVSSSFNSFYVSDGYCNSRILQFDTSSNSFIQQFGSFSSYQLSAPPGQFFIPHSLAIDQQLNRIYIADRENGRVQAFGLETEEFEQVYSSSSWGGRLFAVGVNQKDCSHVAVVNGPAFQGGGGYKGVHVWRVKVDDGEVGSEIGGRLMDPHDVDVDGYGNIYVADLKGRVVKYVSVA